MEAQHSDFVTKAYPKRGDFKAAQMQMTARAQTRFLNNVLMGYLGNQANGAQTPAEITEVLAPPPARCQCRDCEAAMSPIAYLADLLDYAVDHVKNNNAAISLDFLIYAMCNFNG